MPEALVLVWWCWVIASVAIVVRRLLHKVRGGPTPTPWPAAAPAMRTAPGMVGGAAASAAAASAPPVDAATSAAPAAPTLSTALDGIALPCNLTPLTANSIDFVRRAAFATGTHPAEVVGGAVADELERIGMAVESITDTTAVARRDHVAVRVSLHRVGSLGLCASEPDFATAPANSVVVEFELA